MSRRTGPNDVNREAELETPPRVASDLGVVFIHHKC